MARQILLSFMALALVALLTLWPDSPAQPQTNSTTDYSEARVNNLAGSLYLGPYAYVADLPQETLAPWLAAPGEELQKLIEGFPDPDTLATLTETQNPNLSWQRNDGTKIQLDSASRLSWIVVDILYTGTEETTAILDLSGADGIAWSYQGPLGSQLSFADDFTLPQGGRPVFDANAVIPLRLGPQQRTRLHLTVMTISAEKFISFDLLSPDQFRAQRLHMTVLDGAYYGLVLALILYNLFLYVALKRSTHLYFCLFAAASAGMIYVSSGLSLVFGLQNPFPWSLPLIYLAHGAVYMLGAVYSMHLLGIDATRKPLFNVWSLLLLTNCLVTVWLVYAARHGGYSTDNIDFSFTGIVLLWGLNQSTYLYTVSVLWRQSASVRLWFIGISVHISIMGMWPLILDSALFTEFAPYRLAQVTTLFNAMLLSGLIAHQFRFEQTARIQAQQKAVENLRMAHDTERAKSTFVANVGHDLRGPIQAISHFTTALKLKLPGHTHSMLDKIDSNVDKVSVLIDSMTKLSRVEWQGSNPELSPVPLAEVLNELRTEFSAQAVAKNLSLLIQDAPYEVLSDRVCLGQVFRNLTENAIKYTDHGEIRITVSDDPNFVVAMIWDTGRGISDEHLPRIFEEFYQTGPTDSSGVGLGLAIVDRLCRLLDIQVSVASTPGYGTRVTLKMKKFNPQPASELLPQVQESVSVRSLKDLDVIVISESDCLIEPSGWLVNWGANVHIKASRSDIAQCMTDELPMPDVILVDRLSYSEHQKLLHELPVSPLIIIVANTGQLSVAEPHADRTFVVSTSISPMQLRSLLQRNLSALYHTV